MLLNKYVNKVDYSSYEDFKKNFKVNIPASFNFAYDIVDEYAGISPDKTALVWCDENGREETFTFSQMKSYSDRAANFFKSLGIKKGDVVMLILKRHFEFWFACLALHKLGAICIPATHLLTPKDITYRCGAASIKMIVSCADKKVIESVDAAQKNSPTLKFKAVVRENFPGWMNFSEAIEKAPEKFDRPSGKEATSNDDIFLLYFTSGTTGMPKMVYHDFVYPLAHITTAKYWLNNTDNGLHLTVADTGWAKAAWGKLYGQWICGSAVFVYDYGKFIPKNMIEVITRHGVTSFCAPPTIYRYLIKEDLSKYDFSKLKYCCTAGEPLNPEVYNQFLKMTGHKLMEAYGQTETVVQVATYPWMKPKPGSMGKPSPCYDIDIIDDDRKSCEAGEEGQIVLRLEKGKPLGMFKGYYRNEELTKKVWHDNLYYSGDVAYSDEDGYFWFVGRSDDCFKSSGYRIGPFEVESALLEHPAVLECAITAVPDPDRGQIVKATIVLAKNYQASDALKKELQEHVKKVTAPYKYPRIVEFVSELPKTISGKIRRVEIRGKGNKDEKC